MKKKTHTIGGTGVIYPGEVPLPLHDSLNDMVHVEIRVLTGSTPRVWCTSETALDAKHVDTTECVPHNGAPSGTVPDGKSPPHANLSEAPLEVRYKDEWKPYAKLA